EAPGVEVVGHREVRGVCIARELTRTAVAPDALLRDQERERVPALIGRVVLLAEAVEAALLVAARRDGDRARADAVDREPHDRGGRARAGRAGERGRPVAAPAVLDHPRAFLLPSAEVAIEGEGLLVAPAEGPDRQRPHRALPEGARGRERAARRRPERALSVEERDRSVRADAHARAVGERRVQT